MVLKLVGITFSILIISLYECLQVKKEHVKERITVISICIFAWVMSLVLLYFPKLKGPTFYIDQLFSPLGRILE